MRPHLIKAVLRNAIPKQRTVCIEGAPGAGKTTIVREIAKELEIGYIEKHMPTMLVEDFGIPWPEADGDSFNYRLPDWFPSASRDDIPESGVLCFDDRNQCGPDLQKVLRNIQQARNLHSMPMKAGWCVISTGNRQEDRAGSNRVLSHLRDTENVIEFEADLEDWTEWALQNDVRPEVIAFIRFKPNLLHDFDPGRDVNPTPRSWVEGVSNVMDVAPPEAEMEWYKGAVGEGAAAEFTGFLRVYESLPDPESIFQNPRGAQVPTDPATMYALTGALAHHVNKDNIGALLVYLERISPEFSVLCISQAIKKTPAITSTPEFAKWTTTNKSVMF